MPTTSFRTPTAYAQLLRWRADTPASLRLIHLNNAGASLMPTIVRDTIVRHLDLEAEIGGYEAADLAAPEFADTYAALAQLVGAEPGHIAIVDSATAAFSQALSAIDFEPGDRIVTTRADYVSNQLMYLSLARRRGVDVVRADDLPEGGVDPASVEALVRQRRPRLVAVTWIPTYSGLVQDAEAVGAICEREGVPYLVDACQAVGQLPIDVARLRCDYLSATARKFLRGPRGIGFLVATDRALARGAYPLYIDMRGAQWTGLQEFELAPGARRFEMWEFPLALVLGMGVAARYALEVGIPTAQARAWALAAYARERLAAVPGVRVADRGATLSAIVTVQLAGRAAEDVKVALRRLGINTSVSARDNAVIEGAVPSATPVLRISPHYYNTTEEIDRAVAELAAEVSREA
ncbi:MAG TPA: aminotransferase class V-fold PLP-dependent enzyme [Gemmatimonadales bacterium]|nr:aminotransferase class V-fold PLP-dependent enzyme [Gemmatimonadales bacterium]